MIKQRGLSHIELGCVIALAAVLLLLLASRLGQLNVATQLAQAKSFAATFGSQVKQSQLKFMMSGRKPWVIMDDGRAYNFTSQGWISCGDEKTYCPQAQTPNAYAPATGELRGSELMAAHCYGLVKFFFKDAGQFLPASCAASRFGCRPVEGADYKGLFYLDSLGDRCRFISLLDSSVRVEYTNNDGLVKVYDTALIEDDIIAEEDEDLDY